MMLLLPFNVLDLFIQLVTSDGKRAIPALPRKPGMLGINFLYPPGRVLLDLLQQFGLRDRARERRQDMHMIRDATYPIDLRAIVAPNGGKIPMEARTKI